eukprot:3358522-Rhodomonas_salina.1
MATGSDRPVSVALSLECRRPRRSACQCTPRARSRPAQAAPRRAPGRSRRPGLSHGQADSEAPGSDFVLRLRLSRCR